MSKLNDSISWIAFEDEPTILDIEEISSSISVLMLSHVHNIEAKLIAEKIIKLRTIKLKDELKVKK